MGAQLATLCYILHEGELLLIRKKRGIGAGKINGPGGKVDPGEEPLAAAIREVQEETGVTPLDPVHYGTIRFHFADGLVLQCLVYLSLRFEGVPYETDEALPLWFPVTALPFDEMWEDDRHWLPLLLRRQIFTGAVQVDANTVTKHSFHVS